MRIFPHVCNGFIVAVRGILGTYKSNCADRAQLLLHLSFGRNIPNSRLFRIRLRGEMSQEVGEVCGQSVGKQSTTRPY